MICISSVVKALVSLFRVFLGTTIVACSKGLLAICLCLTAHRPRALRDTRWFTAQHLPIEGNTRSCVCETREQKRRPGPLSHIDAIA